MNLSASWQHDHVDAYSSADVIASIESVAAEAINSIQAAGAAARRATEQPLLPVNDAVDHIIDASEAADVRFTRVAAGASSTVTSTDDAYHDFAMNTTSHVGQVNSSAGNGASLDADKGSSPISSVDAVNPAHMPLTMSGLEGDGSGTVTSTDASGEHAVVIPVGGTLELAAPYSGTISFDGAIGTLKVDNSASFSGKIDGQLAIGDVIDFADITAGASATISYSGNNSPGTLTVSDGTHTASVALLGNYSLANFTASCDGHGGTSVIEPAAARGRLCQCSGRYAAAS